MVDLERNICDPRPLAPGEKIAIFSGRGKSAEVQDYGAIQQHLVKFFGNRHRIKKYLNGQMTLKPEQPLFLQNPFPGRTTNLGLNRK